MNKAFDINSKLRARPKYQLSSDIQFILNVLTNHIFTSTDDYFFLNQLLLVISSPGEPVTASAKEVMM